MAGKKTKGPDDATAQRLKRLRSILDYRMANDFAAAIGISPQRLSNIENGMPLSRDVAFKLVRLIPGLTLDWLYFGKIDGLPVGLARRLGELGPTEL